MRSLRGSLASSLCVVGSCCQEISSYKQHVTSNMCSSCLTHIPRDDHWRSLATPRSLSIFIHFFSVLIHRDGLPTQQSCTSYAPSESTAWCRHSVAVMLKETSVHFVWSSEDSGASFNPQRVRLWTQPGRPRHSPQNCAIRLLMFPLTPFCAWHHWCSGCRPTASTTEMAGS